MESMQFRHLKICTVVTIWRLLPFVRFWINTFTVEECHVRCLMLKLSLKPQIWYFTLLFKVVEDGK